MKLYRNLITLFFTISLFMLIYLPAKINIIPTNLQNLESWKLNLLNFCIYLTFTCCVVAFAKRVGLTSWAELGMLWNQENKNWRYWIMYGILVNLAFHIIRFAYWSSLSNFMSLSVEEIVPYNQKSLYYLTSKYLFSPIFEETIFRGIIFSRVESLSNSATAIICSSLFFWAAHFFYGNQNVFQIYQGITLAYCFYKTRSLFWPIILHAMANFIADGYSIVEWISPGSTNKFFLW